VALAVAVALDRDGERREVGVGRPMVRWARRLTPSIPAAVQRRAMSPDVSA
jgi:hypothetical protein